ncbi:MAG: hypothetical protein WCC60_16965 [Ilumatobacteraceae bacterium]
MDSGITTRLEHLVRSDFVDAESALEVLCDVESGNQDRERVLAAVVFAARGDVSRLHQLVELSRVDWRDVLVGGGLGNIDWPHVLDERLGVIN